jgi:hypothetical protein
MIGNPGKKLPFIYPLLGPLTSAYNEPLFINWLPYKDLKMHIFVLKAFL